MSVLASRTKRLTLPAGERAWEPIGGARDALKLGYRRGARGGASWMAKARVSGVVHQERLGDADDIEPGQGLSYTDAIATAGRWRDHLAVRLNGEKTAKDAAVSEAAREMASVRGHIREYLSQREEAKGKASATHAHQILRAHVLGDPIADLEVSALAVADIKAWRSRLRKATRTGGERSERMQPATEKRLLSDVRAALSKSLTSEARAALTPQAGAGSVARELPYWSPAEIVAVTTAARVVDEALGDMVLVLAATGARFSQARRIRVRDVLMEAEAILVPRSAKGSGTKSRALIRVPVQADVIAALRPLLAGRRGDEPLLQRWSWRKTHNGKVLVWVKDGRVPWSTAKDMLRGWNTAVAKAFPEMSVGIPPYVLRHSSIVRWLRSGTHAEIVADLHDTSTEMLSQTYGADMASKAEDILRERLKGMGSLTAGATVSRLKAV